MRSLGREALGRLDLAIDPRARVADLSVGQKQMVEVAKALSQGSKVIVMDEPTASLSHHEADTLLAVVRQLREDGIGVVYITHRLDEVFALADRVSVLRDGRTVASWPIGEATREGLVRAMVDRDLNDLYGAFASHRREAVVLEVEDLTLTQPRPHEAWVRGISFRLHQGEVLGVFGLIGAGRTQVMEMIFGQRAFTGRIRVGGEPLSVSHPRDAMEAGLGFVTEDRKSQGLVAEMTVRENFSLTHLESYCRWGFVGRSRETEACARAVQDLGVKTPSIEQKVVNLSGGNQQKLVIGKWIVRRPRVLIVDEPTRGIDIGAKAEVHREMQRLAEDGMGLIVVSSDLAEVLAVSDRVLVMQEGRVSGELPRERATRERVMELATG